MWVISFLVTYLLLALYDYEKIKVVSQNTYNPGMCPQWLAVAGINYHSDKTTTITIDSLTNTKISA